MTNFFQNVFTRYPIKTKRMLEILPGAVSWMLILFPIWGSFFIPFVVAYFILFFDVYWFYKSFNLVITAFIASRKIKKAEKENWLDKARKCANFDKMRHVAIIPNYKENLNKLKESISSIAHQTFPAKRIYIVLAMEEREIDGKQKAQV